MGGPALGSGRFAVLRDLKTRVRSGCTSPNGLRPIALPQWTQTFLSQRPAGCRQLPRGGWLVVAVKGLLTGGPAVCVILPWVPAKRLWGQLHPGSRHQSCSPSRHRQRRPRCTLPLGRRSWAGLAALLGRGRLCSSEDEEAEGGQEAGRRIGTHHGNGGRMPQARLRAAGGVLRVVSCRGAPRPPGSDCQDGLGRAGPRAANLSQAAKPAAGFWGPIIASFHYRRCRRCPVCLRPPRQASSIFLPVGAPACQNRLVDSSPRQNLAKNLRRFFPDASSTKALRHTAAAAVKNSPTGLGSSSRRVAPQQH
jgi:hypothetical protein